MNYRHYDYLVSGPTVTLTVHGGLEIWEIEEVIDTLCDLTGDDNEDYTITPIEKEKAVSWWL